jgi:hypothetical protein
MALHNTPSLPTLPWIASILICVGSSTGFADPADTQFAREDLDFFESHVRPLLVEHCYGCHSGRADKLQAGLRLDGRDAILTGGDSGPAINLKDVDASLLLQSVRYESYEMPPTGKLSNEQIDILEQWIRQGAAWPAESAQHANATLNAFNLEERRNSHWVWQPLSYPPLPEVKDTDWPRTSIDQFVLAKLEANGLKPTHDANSHALQRRLSFDLTGLPPISNAFEMAASSNLEFETHVDRLLASPHFGEHWGRHWLDLMRYAESRGHEFDNDMMHAYQYRDYVIRALNADVPYDTFVREHIAGDLVETPRLHPVEKFDESILGTGFWYLGDWNHSPVDIRKDESDRLDNMLDVFSKSFLGVTVACARCHDHKFDAISTRDYYALRGFLQGSEYREVRFDSELEHRALSQALDQIDESFQQSFTELLKSIGLQPFQLDPDLSQRISAAIAPEHWIANFAIDPPSGFLQDGYAFRHVPLGMVGHTIPFSIASEPCVALDPFWNRLESVEEVRGTQRSAVLSLPRSGRTLRTHSFELTEPSLEIKLRGVGHVVLCVDSHRMVFGPLHGETVRKFEHREQMQWLRIPLEKYVGHRMHVEFVPANQETLELQFIAQGITQAEQELIDKQLEAARESLKSWMGQLFEQYGRVQKLESQMNSLVASSHGLDWLWRCGMELARMIVF